MSIALLLDTNILNSVPVITYVPAKFFELGLMISGSEAVVLYLASVSEDHEQEFTIRGDFFAIIHSSVPVCSSLLTQDNLCDFPAGNCDRTGQAPCLYRAVSFSVTSL